MEKKRKKNSKFWAVRLIRCVRIGTFLHMGSITTLTRWTSVLEACIWLCCLDLLHVSLSCSTLCQIFYYFFQFLRIPAETPNSSDAAVALDADLYRSLKRLTGLQPTPVPSAAVCTEVSLRAVGGKGVFSHDKYLCFNKALNDMYFLTYFQTVGFLHRGQMRLDRQALAAAGEKQKQTTAVSLQIDGFVVFTPISLQ